MSEEKSCHKWYSQPIFDHFWNHYNHCNEWLQQNGHQIIEFSDHFSDDYNNSLNECNISSFDVSKDTNISHKHKVETKMDELEVIDENECKNNENKDNDIDSDDSDLLDISEDYLKFVMQTKRHQLERKRLREMRLKYNERVEYVDISQTDHFFTKSCAPIKNSKNYTNHKIKHISNQTNDQMFQLYGEDYNLIQGMEAALQLNFDRLCDRFQPKFWPIVPIRM
jgi:gem associated protein 8